VGLHVVCLVWLITTQFPTRDEVAHVPAGLSYLRSGCFSLYRVNPPLPRLVQAVPVWLAGADIDDIDGLTDGRGKRDEWKAARLFAARNRGDYLQLMTLARLPGILWSLLGLYLVRTWSKQLYGDRAAFLATVLWCFGPNILAHASLATPDLPCAVLCLAAVFLIHRYLQAPSLRSAYLAGLVLGLAQLTKFTALIVYLVWAILILVAVFSTAWPAFRRLGCWRRVGHAVVLLGASVVVLNLGYACEGTLTRLGQFDFVSRTLTTETDGIQRNAFEESWLGQFPVPLPANYLRGMDLQQADFEDGRRSYLGGEWRDHGWWYFYLYALGVKVPIGTLALGALGLAFSFTSRFRRFDELAVWVPACLVFGVASAKTGFTLHFRYVLPALPFALVGLSKVAEVQSHRARGLVVILAGWSVLSSALVFPHSLAYFNEAAGGPSHGDAHLIDSNLDWGQDLLRFKRWLDAHGEARPLHLAYEHLVDYRLAGLPDLPRPPVDPADLTPGYYALDIQSLRAGRFGYFLRLRPTDRIGYTIRVYRVTQADIDNF
jgi:hypothetical protein